MPQWQCYPRSQQEFGLHTRSLSWQSESACCSTVILSQYTISDLAEAEETSSRTIRYYIARELLPPPRQVGRNAVYGREHLERLEEIGRLKAKGLTLHEIGIEPREARDDGFRLRFPFTLVAVVERADDQPGQPPRTKIVPVGVPEGVEFDAYFNAKAVRHSAPHKVCYSMREAKVTAYSPPGDYEDYKLFDQPDVQSTHVQDILDRLVARIETDGGMPGADKRERLANTLVALRLLQTAARRQYKRYERRLLDFIMHCEIGLLPHFATRIEEGLDRIDAQLAITGNIRPRSDAWKDAATELLDGKLDTDRILKTLQT